METTASKTSTKGHAFVNDMGRLVQKTDVTSTDVLHMYEKYAQDYDKAMLDINFQAPALAAQYFHKHACRMNLSKDCAILDVGAGTGRCGQLLQTQYGYTTVDGMDPCERMLNQAKKRGVYRNLFVGKVGEGNKIPADDDAYTAAVVAGCLTRGHVSVDSFLEIIRVVKPGGLIVNSMREEFTWQDADCDVRKPFATWEAEGRWNIVEWVIPNQEYYDGKEAMVHVYKVCAL